MTKRMLIDAVHDFETRVAVIDQNHLEEFDFETEEKSQLKGNIYLAKVTRVEPSLQACFVDYGGNRHGFLAFTEIHPDYFQIPVSDREKFMAEVEEEEKAELAKAKENSKKTASSSDDPETDAEVEVVVDDDNADVENEVHMEKILAKRRAKWLKRMIRSYKIQEVIKKNQILLIQVNKEERGNKGAALTTYLSLAGKYCVLMPNTGHGGGVSRKIATGGDRKRLKTIVEGLDVPNGMSIIIRTAGAKCTKVEIKRDYAYLTKMWDQIRESTLQATAPELIYEEANLIKRAVRDIYTKEIDEVLVQGPEGYKTAKSYMRMMMPSHVKKVQEYKDKSVSILQKHRVEDMIQEMHTPTVQLKSGGYLVINHTEALVAVDVNSGRATKERDIEKTAFRTNIESADEVARQMRLRDLSGLVVIDFIDMLNRSNNRKVEKAMKDALKRDRARVQSSRISEFGLMEISRQRLRPSISDITMESCTACEGTGKIRSMNTVAIEVVRKLEQVGQDNPSLTSITLKVGGGLAVALLNKYRRLISDLEDRLGFTLELEQDDALNHAPYYVFEGQPKKDGQSKRSNNRDKNSNRGEKSDDRRGGRNRRRNNNRDRDRNNNRDDKSAASNNNEEATSAESAGKKPDSRRGSRGGRNRKSSGSNNATKHNDAQQQNEEAKVDVKADAAADTKSEAPKKAKATRGRKPKTAAKSDSKPAKKAAAGKSKPAAKEEVVVKEIKAKARPPKEDKDVALVTGSPEKPKRGWWGR